MHPAPTTGYMVANQCPPTVDHHTAVAELLDPNTIRRLTRLDSGTDWAGAQCLELGAGTGSIAWWLADRVDLFGRVTAVDLDTSRLTTHPRIQPLRHDLRDGTAALPPGPYDLIHARLLLAHLPNPDHLLADLAILLAPGGTILIEDWAPGLTPDQVIVTAPTRAAAAAYAQFQHTINEQVIDHASTDTSWGRRIHPAMLAAGLVDVDTEVHAQYWTGGSPGCRAIAAGLTQLRPQLLAFLTNEHLDQIADLLTDPRLVVHGNLLYATSGRRPKC